MKQSPHAGKSEFSFCGVVHVDDFANLDHTDSKAPGHTDAYRITTVVVPQMQLLTWNIHISASRRTAAATLRSLISPL